MPVSVSDTVGAGIFRANEVNIMSVNALAPCVARPSSTMILSVCNADDLVFKAPGTNFHALFSLSVDEWREIQIYIYIFLVNSVRWGLIHVHAYWDRISKISSMNKPKFQPRSVKHVSGTQTLQWRHLSVIVSQITGNSTVGSIACSSWHKNINSMLCITGSLRGESTGDQRFPHTAPVLRRVFDYSHGNIYISTQWGQK